MTHRVQPPGDWERKAMMVAATGLGLFIVFLIWLCLDTPGI